MELIKFEDYILKYNSPLAATIGSFDGIHLGHQSLMKEVVETAIKNNCKSAVITFEPHPLTIIKNVVRQNITSLEEKSLIIEKLGIDFLIIIDFNKEFSTISKYDFVNNYLIKLNVKELIVGDDFKFGKLGEGKASEINFLSNGLINTKIVKLIEYEMIKIGSSRIINLLNNGEITLVNKLLGYNYFFTGRVIKGNQIGRKMGFPTCNIDNDNVKKLLKKGVYGVRVYVNDLVYLGMMNIGNNPTCNYTENLSMEINLFDVNIDLYDQNLKIECICYVRDEVKFNNSNELIEQLKKDKEFIINKNLMLAKK